MKNFREFFTRFNFSERGQCQICGKDKKLTSDHVPPKGCGNKGLYEIYDMPGKQIKQKARNGIQFKTICSNCNNHVLGEVDTDLIKMANQVKVYRQSLKNGINYPEGYDITISPKRIIRAFLGHILAARGQMEAGEIKASQTIYWQNIMRLFNGENLVNYCLCIWLHDHSTINIYPGLGLTDIRKSTTKPTILSVLSFFPIGFLVTDDRNWAFNRKTTRLRVDQEFSTIDLTKLPRFKPAYPLDQVAPTEIYAFASRHCYYAKRTSGLFF